MAYRKKFWTNTVSPTPTNTRISTSNPKSVAPSPNGMKKEIWSGNPKRISPKASESLIQRLFQFVGTKNPHGETETRQRTNLFQRHPIIFGYIGFIFRQSQSL